MHCCYRSRGTGGDGGGGNGGGGGSGSYDGGEGDGGDDRGDGGDGGGSSGGDGGGGGRCCVPRVVLCHAMLVCIPVLMILIRLWPLRRAMHISRKQPKNNKNQTKTI